MMLRCIVAAVVLLSAAQQQLVYALTEADDAAALQPITSANPTIASTHSWTGLPCTKNWRGVSCLDSGGGVMRVNKVNLTGLSLVGTIPSLASMDFLEELDLSDNSFSGTVPATGPALRKLLLTSNMLSGDSTASLSALCTASPALQILDISSNPELNGTLPDCWGSMTQLQKIIGFMTGLSGVLPNAWNSSTSITHIDLSYTSWEPYPHEQGSWPDWTGMINLEYLDLSGSAGYNYTILDPLPTSPDKKWFPNQPNMSVFICRGCQWKYAADPGMSGWAKLKYIDISYNPLESDDSDYGYGFFWDAPANTTPTHILPLSWQSLPLHTVKARGCNLRAAESEVGLSDWTDPNTLFTTLRVLDVRDNPDLAFTDMGNFFGKMKLWELYLGGTDVGLGNTTGWPGLPCILDTTNNTALVGVEIEDTDPDQLVVCRTDPTPEWEALLAWSQTWTAAPPHAVYNATVVPTAPNFQCPAPPLFGITCHPGTGRIIKIEIQERICNPACPLSPALFSAATALISFNVRGANVSADLSSLDLTDSYFLEKLILANNPAIKGPLNPYWPTRLAYLKTLDLSGTSNMGPVPETWGSLSDPSLPFWGDYLEHLYLAHAGVTDLPATWELSKLSYLDLSNNNLTGNFSALLTPELEFLDLSFSGLHGGWQAPYDWSALGLVKTLRVNGISIAGSFPNELLSAPLEVFHAVNTGMEGTLPDFSTSSAWANLSTIQLQDNSITGSLPLLDGLTSLNLLDLSNNALTGTLVMDLPLSLQHLHLFSNDLTGSLPAEWSSATSLTTLDLSLNQLTGTLPLDWRGLANMKTLRLSGNYFTGTLPDWAGTSTPAMTNLSYFACANCGLSGSLPNWGEDTCLNVYHSLTHLDLSNNAFTGTVPITMSGYGYLEAFNVTGNQLTDVFSGALNCNMDKLRELRVSFNNLTDEIPNVWTTFNALEVLDASNNAFTGSLPVFQTSLRQLYLEHNGFSGSIPTGYDNHFSCLTLNQNPELCGTVPDGMPCFDKTGTKLGLDCTDFQTMTQQSGCKPDLRMCDPAHVPHPSPQTQALLSWKDSFIPAGGFVPGQLASWVGDNACTWKWQGVECDAAGQVVAIRLNETNLQERQPLGNLQINWQALANITALRELELPTFFPDFESTNHPPPPELGQLTNLQVLDLSGSKDGPPMGGNSFGGGGSFCGGPLPSSWSQLTNIVKLNIGNCHKATGRKIPAEWGSLSLLQELRAENAGLTGTLDELPITNGSMPQLRVLLLSKNPELSGTMPAAWSHLPLQVLSLGYTNVESNLPVAWADANSTLQSTIQELYLHKTRRDGPIPQEWLLGFNNITLFTIWGTGTCGPHPETASGLGHLCLDTTETRLGFNCTGDTWKPIADGQTPSTCMLQTSLSNYSAPSPIQAYENTQDRETLRNIKTALGNPAFLASWNGPYDMPCGSPRWEWVNCWDGQVAEIAWSNMGLSGSLPSELSHLRGLQKLDLSLNNFSGMIPSTFGDYSGLTNLRHLNLSSNRLTGPLPTSMSKLNSLERLDLSFNTFSGNLPTEWGDCGTKNTPLGCMSNLLQLECSSCSLSGPLPVWRHGRLQLLGLSHNNIAGGLPDSNLHNLQMLDLSYNVLDRLPADDYFKNFTSFLKKLNLRGNNLTGTLAPGWGRSSLISIDLSQNKISGQLPGAWLKQDPAASFNKLEEINVADNMLTGGFPQEWSMSLAPLRSLILSNNPGLSANITMMKLPSKLQKLHIANTNITGSFTPSWMNMQNPGLNCLVAYGSSKLCGALDSNMPCSLVNFTHGTSLGKDCSTLAVLAAPGSCKPSDLQSCLPALSDASVLLSWKAQLTDPNNTLANWVGYNPCDASQPWMGITCSEDRMAVVAVNLAGLGLQGPLVGGLSMLTNLQVLNVSNNQLFGQLPGDFGSLKQLRILDVSTNNLTGPFPPSWASMYNLRRLDASNNMLQGEIPAEWGNGTYFKQPDEYGMPMCGDTPCQQNPNMCGNEPCQPKYCGNLPCDPAMNQTGPNGTYSSNSSMPNTTQSQTQNQQPWQPPNFMASLVELVCNNCGLSGVLPWTWHEMDSLGHVSLAHNSFTGSVPSFGAPKLQSLILDGNPLQTWLPYLEGSAPLLKRLSLANCKMMGDLSSGWSRLGLQHLDLSNNAIVGGIPASWTDPTYGALAASLQVLLLNGNNLAGAMPPSMNSMTALSCWSVATNMDLCGAAPPSYICGDTANTHIGQECGTLAQLGGNSSCSPAPEQCLALLNASASAAPTISNADADGLLALKNEARGPGGMMPVCPNMTEFCGLFNTWNPSSQPCQVPDCVACTFDQLNCGMPNGNATTCKWRFVECKMGRVSRIMLDYIAFGGSGPQITFMSLPPALSTLTKLEELHLSQHIIVNGSLPDDMANMTNLRVLHLAGPLAGGSTLPAAWSQMANLQSLWLLNMPGLTGGLPDAWGSGPMNLKQLRVTLAPNISGPIPSSWGSFSQLQQLELVGLNLAGQLPATWVAGMSFMTNISLQDMPQVQLPSSTIRSWLVHSNLTRIDIRKVGGMTGQMLDPDLPAFYPNLVYFALSGLGLTGNMPASWQSLGSGAFGKLKVFDLSGNMLGGSLPDWLTYVTGPGAVVDMSSNNFTGRLSPSWGNSPTDYTLFSLANNMLTGPIPDSIAWVAFKSAVFDLSTNKLQGALGPNWYNISMPNGSMPMLMSFNVQNNPCLCGGVPGWIRMVHDSNDTAAYNMSSNGTTTNTTDNSTMPAAGTIMQPCSPELEATCAQSLWPPEYLQDSLQLLALKTAADNNTQMRLNTWKASVPPCTSSATNGSCVMCDDKLPEDQCGTSRPSDGQLTCNWRYIECRDRRVTTINLSRKDMVFSSLPAALANGTSLEVLDLSNSPVMGGVLPTEYAAWTNLTTFRVAGNVVGPLPVAYTSWSKLKAFEVTGTNLTGTIPADYFASWPLLESFTVDGAAITGHVPPPWACTQLKSYVVQNTPVVSNATHPVWLLDPQAATMTKMEMIGLGGTLLQLPSWTGLKETLRSYNWQNLTAVSFPGLRLSGPIGPLQYYFPNLTMLDLSFNQFTGIIPPELSTVYNKLVYVNISSNALYGTLPAGLLRAFAPAPDLALDLSRNKLSGTLPDLLNSTSTFWTVNLSHNKFTGSIPDSYTPLIAETQQVDFSNLILSGSLPASLSAVNASKFQGWGKSIHFSNNPCLCGSMPAWLPQYSMPNGTSGTGLGAACGTCSYNVSQTTVHQDWAGLVAIRSAVYGAPNADIASKMLTWTTNVTLTPCHDIDPNCKQCPWDLPSGTCGTQIGLSNATSGPPQYYCNAIGVPCTDGRVTAVNMSTTGLVFSQLPAGVSQLSRLQELDFEGVQVNAGPVPAAWANLTALTGLQLSFLQPAAFDSLPAIWGNLTLLKQLKITNASFTTGGLPEQWSNATMLQSITLQNINFTASGQSLPAGWASLSNLIVLKLLNIKGLSGPLPSAWITGFSALKELQLSAVPGLNATLADFVGMANQPLRIVNSTGLEVLSLAQNNMTGALHTTEWDYVRSLKLLNLSYNRISGSLPSTWSKFRGKSSIDVSNNNISGPLPESWGLLGTDSLTMQLALLNASRNSITGTLPASYANLSTVTPTALVLSNNNLTGSLPEVWGARNLTEYNGSLWSEVDVAHNSLVCGVLPQWYITLIQKRDPKLAAQGTLLGDACQPAAFTHFFNTLGALMPTIGRQLTLQLVSKTPFATLTGNTSTPNSWQVSLASRPGSGFTGVLGTMQQLKNVSADYYWQFQVPGNVLNQLGKYTFSVSSTSNVAGDITNSPLAATLYPAVAAADASSVTVNMTSRAVGGAALVTCWVNEANGTARTFVNGTKLTIAGNVSGTMSITSDKLTVAAPGQFTFTYTAEAIESLNFTLYVDGAPASSNFIMNITSVLPSAINSTATLRSLALQREGEAARTNWTGANLTAVLVPASSWHRLYLPIMKAAGGIYRANPGLSAQLVLEETGASNATASGSSVAATNNTSNATINATGSQPQLVFPAYWSSSNASYVFMFKIPSPGNYTGQLQLRESNTTATAFVYRNVSFTVTQLLPAASMSTFTTLGPARAGDALYIIATLRSAQNRTVNMADNVQLQVKGSVSGASTVGALARQPDGTWATKLVPLREETLTITMTVGGQPAGTKTVVIAGRSLALLSFNSSLQQATLVSQVLAVTDYVHEGGLLMAYMDDTSFLYVPVVDVAGNLVAADPNIKSVLSLVPASKEAAILKRYNLTAANAPSPSPLPSSPSPLPPSPLPSPSPSPLPPSPSPSPSPLRRALLDDDLDAAHRPLLQTTTNTSNVTTWTYFLDYEEPPLVEMLEPPPVLQPPPTYVFTQPLTPDTGNVIQDSLGTELGVASYMGVFDAAKGSYTFTVLPPALDTYLAVLSIRHPNISSSFCMTKFHLAVVPNPATLASPAPNATTATPDLSTVTAASIALYNPLVNPRISFVSAFPRLAASTYAGGSAKALADFKAVVAATAVLDGPSWVQADILPGLQLVVNATLWFPSTYANVSSPFEGLSAMDYYLFLLKKLPTVAFTSESYPSLVATNVNVTNFTVTLPGGTPMDGFTYGAASSTSGGTGTTVSSDTAASNATATVKVVDIAVSDMQVVVAASSTAALTPAVDITKVVDTTPPVLTLNGEPYMQVLQADKYADQGARAFDNIDGNNVVVVSRLQLCARPTGMETAAANDSRPLTCGPALATTNTTLSSRSNETYVFTYTARDAAGNQAVPLRRYVVVNSRCPSTEKWCPNIGACSTQGLCLKPIAGGSGSASGTASSTTSASAAAVYVPPVDKTPPKLKLLGTGAAAVTATGAAIMMDNVTWKSTWQDPGASAIDAVDGNLSSSIQSYGAGAVDTSIPTSPSKEFGFVVEYYVEDKSGNAAPIARRLIKVMCPKGESFCMNPDTNQPTCTINGVCGASQLLSFGSSAPTSSLTATTAKSMTNATIVAAAPTPPKISLLVPGQVQILAGEIYDRCSENSAITAVCERGVLAEDEKDGNMERQVMVCGSRWRPQGNQKAVPLLLACGITNDVPGDYKITYSITNSAGLTASVNRSITIKPVCPVGEALCSDKVTCSTGGSCVSFKPASSSFPGTSGTSTSTSSSASAAAAAASVKVELPNQPPVIALRNATNFGSIVYIRRMGTYEPCKEGVAPAAESPCEPGADAYDPDGAVAGSSAATNTGVNKTGEVVVCPPAQCVNGGCSPMELRRHYYTAKGLKGCGVDTSLPEGTQIKIDFWVWDSGTPMLNASVSRTLVIDKPCPSASAPYFCQDSAGRGFCSGSPCGTTTKLLPPPKPKPQIHLKPTAAPVVYVAYGQPAPFYLGPCSTGLKVSSCGAVAWDVKPGQQNEDLTPYIAVTQRRDDCAEGQPCPTCDLAALSASGNCMPGRYRLIFTVANNDGATDLVERQVVVYLAASVSAQFALYKNVTNASVAEGIAVELLDTTSQEFADGADKILKSLPAAAAARFDAQDVVITAANVTEQASDGFTVLVDTKFYVYVPQGVHKQEVKAFEAELAVAASNSTNSNSSQAQGRRLMATESVTGTAMTSSGVSAPSTAPVMRRRSEVAPGEQDDVTDWQSKDYTVVSHVQHFLALLQEAAEASSCSLGDAACTTSALASPRRQLLQTDNELGSALATLSGSLVNDLGASSTSSQGLTVQEVDLIGAYTSALTSSMDVLEHRVSQLETSGTALSTSITLAFGQEAEQRDTKSEQGVTQLYQDLVSTFSTMASSISSLADQAAVRFDLQRAAATRLASSMSEAITSMREAAAITEAMREKYIQQTLMMNAATGQLVDVWECNRTRHSELHFIANSSNVNATTTATGRRLLAHGGSVGATSSWLSMTAGGVGELTQWNGFSTDLFLNGQYRRVFEGDTAEPEVGRYVGSASSNNRVVGGLFLHTTRKKSNTEGCAGSGLKSKYDFNCQKSVVPLARNATVLSNYLLSLFAGDSNDIHPYGVDPAFLRNSIHLYRPELQGKEDWFYNTSNPLEMSPTNMPYGFFHQPLQGYDPGFAVLLPTRLSQYRSAEAMQYLMDGNYLDKQSKGLTAELLTYNSDLRVIGYSSVSFEWEDNGAIKGFVDVRAMPALKTTAEGGSNELALWLVPMWLLCIAFCVMTAVEVRQLLHHYEGNHWMLVLLRSSEFITNFVTAGIMLAAVGILTVFCMVAAPSVRPKPAYEMYDGASINKARMFMPAKVFSPTAVTDGLAALASTRNLSNAEASDAVLNGGWQPISPGTAGRWLLPDAAEGEWTAWAELMNGLHAMSKLWAAYTLLQGVILVLLIIKLVRSWSFQSKLGIITNTLLEAAPKLAHLVLVIMSCIVLFAALSNIGIGRRVQQASSYAAALEETFRSLLGLGYIKVLDIFPRLLDQPRPEYTLSVLIFYGREILFVMLLGQYFMATLGSVFVQLKAQQLGSKSTSIAQDVARDVLPEVRSTTTRKLLGPKYSTTARDANGAAVTMPSGSEALYAFFKLYYPQLIESKAFGNISRAIKIGDKYISLPVLKQLLSELSVTDAEDNFQAQERPRSARRSPTPTAPEAWSEPSAGTTTAHPAVTLSTALAVSEQLVNACGRAVDVKCLQDGEQQLEAIAQSVELQSELKAGVDYTVQDLQAVLDRELGLHQQIHDAIWTAVFAMERWSAGVARWQAKVTKEINTWMAANAELLTSEVGPKAAGTVYLPIPEPKTFDKFGRRTRDSRSSATGDLEKQQDFGATVVVTAKKMAAVPPQGDAIEASPAHAAAPRMEPLLPKALMIPSESEAELLPGTPHGLTRSPTAPGLTPIGPPAAQTPGFGSSAGSRWSSSAGVRHHQNIHVEVSATPKPSDGRHAPGDSEGLPVTPGSVSLHSRMRTSSLTSSDDRTAQHRSILGAANRIVPAGMSSPAVLQLEEAASSDATAEAAASSDVDGSRE